MSIVARLEEDALDPEQELGALLERAKGDGAVVSFTGLVRGVSKDGQTVDRLVLELSSNDAPIDRRHCGRGSG